MKPYTPVKMPVGILAAWYVGRCCIWVTDRPRWDGSPWDHPSPLRIKVSILCFGLHMLALVLFVHICTHVGTMTQLRHKISKCVKMKPNRHTEPQNGKCVGNFPARVHLHLFWTTHPPKGHWLILFQHGDNRSYSAGRINWHLHPLGPWRCLPVNLRSNAEALASILIAI